MTIRCDPFGRTAEGVPVELYTLANAAGMEARVMTYGGTLVSLRVPDRRGDLGDVVLGFDTLAPYLAGHPYFGSLVGRYANRIAHGRFTLDGVEHRLACNDGAHHLHGGARGFDKVLWSAECDASAATPSLALNYVSRAGEEGYPGRLRVNVVYTVTPDNGLQIEYSASCDATTIVNLTNHAYFNLAGAGDVLGHELQILASAFLPVDDGLIPTGERRAVEGSAFDFRQPTRIGARIAADDEQLKSANGGYDHNWNLDQAGAGLSLGARVREPRSGRVIEVYTTQPGIQFYSGNFLDGTLTGKGGAVYRKHAGFCLETQHFPDSPNHPDFPITVLAPHTVYRHTTVYRCSTA